MIRLSDTAIIFKHITRYVTCIIVKEVVVMSKRDMESKEDQQRMLSWNWIGHLLTMKKDIHCLTTLTCTLGCKRKVGHPKTTWQNYVEKDKQIVERSQPGGQRGSWASVVKARRLYVR